MAPDAISFEPGRDIVGKWKVVKKLGAGGCGSVFLVENKERKGFLAAMKVEPIKEDEEGVLKLEASVLKKLKDKNNVIRLIAAGKRNAYNFIVITLCGSDLMTLRKKSPEGMLSESSIVRMGVQSLYAIKQLHEIGYVHRDVKPGNVMNGGCGRSKKMFFLIDYGMTRSFVINVNGKPAMRTLRKNVLLRGTLRYCSMNVHKRNDQGRVDDLWSMLYMLCELYGGLPWNRTKEEKEIQSLKQKTTDAEVFKECPAEFLEIAVHLRTLSYADRPDYFKIYELFMKVMRSSGYSFRDPYCWEQEDKSKAPDTTTAVEYSEREKTTHKPLQDNELDFLYFPTTHPNYFKEKILAF